MYVNLLQSITLTTNEGDGDSYSACPVIDSFATLYADIRAPVVRL